MDDSTIALYCFGTLAGGMAIFVSTLFIRAKIKIGDSKSWPKTMGVITHSSVDSGFTRIGGDNIFIARPKVIYEYEVSGKRYTSSQLAIIETNTASEDSAREKAEKYVLGQHVDVFYDPRNPSFAVLER